MNLIKRIILKNSRKLYSTQIINSKFIKKKICVIGSGPAGFYATQYLLKHLENCEVHLLEKLPVPFGLVRFGVAPDHPEVKNVINTFSKTAENGNFKFFGNFKLGKNCTLKDLRNLYHAVILAYGSEQDRKLGIPNEEKGNVLSARDFVAWYNGLPGAENLNPSLKADSVSIIGQGNVAIDVARILLSPVDLLRNTDITQYALEELSSNKIQRVNLIGRRGPLQAAFTIKELREMLKLQTVNTIWRKTDFEGVAEEVSKLQRPRKRLTELMLSSLQNQKESKSTYKQFIPIFFRSPIEFTEHGVNCCINKLENNQSVSTNATEFFSSDLLFRSIGYKAISCDCDINFNEKIGCVVNDSGRVLLQNPSNSQEKIDKGLYVTGWLGTGPTGVIITTMNNAFTVAKAVCDDINSKKLYLTENKPGISNNNYVTWEGWKRIDQFEIEQGKKLNKPREKLIDVSKMLEIANI